MPTGRSLLLGLLAALLPAAAQSGLELRSADAGAVAVDGELAIIPPAQAVEGMALPNSALARARALVAPAPTAKVGGEFEHEEFWEEHAATLRAGWAALGLRDPSLADFRHSFVEPQLAAAVSAAQARPAAQAEGAIRALWTEAAPGVFSGRLLRPEVVRRLRQELDRFAVAGIPTRRPNGMNRHGVILDAEAPGAVGSLTGLVEPLIAEYVRPLVAMLFPDAVGTQADMQESFSFTVRYKEGEGQDVALSEHRDASVATLNINLNTAEESEGYGGSEVYFVDEHDSAKRRTVRFSPGMAILHKGALRHGATDITGGERLNLIVWLFGEGGEVRVAPYTEGEQMTAAQRWAPQGPPLTAPPPSLHVEL